MLFARVLVSNRTVGSFGAAGEPRLRQSTVSWRKEGRQRDGADADADAKIAGLPIMRLPTTVVSKMSREFVRVRKMRFDDVDGEGREKVRSWMRGCVDAWSARRVKRQGRPAIQPEEGCVVRMRGTSKMRGVAGLWVKMRLRDKLTVAVLARIPSRPSIQVIIGRMIG